MNTAIFVTALVAAGAACPLHMWWQRRRGRKAACCAGRPVEHAAAEVEALRARQEQLRVQIAALEAPVPGGTAPTEPKRG